MNRLNLDFFDHDLYLKLSSKLSVGQKLKVEAVLGAIPITLREGYYWLVYLALKTNYGQTQ